MSDKAMILGAVAVLAAAAYANVVGGMPQAVIHRTGSTALGIVGLAFSYMCAAEVPAHPERIIFVLGLAAASCLALAGWNELCGVGGSWRTRWIVAGVALGVVAGVAGYAGDKIQTAAAAEAQVAKARQLELRQMEASKK